MDDERVIELFRQLSMEDQPIVLELLKYSLTLSTVDLYRLIEELERI